VMFTFRGEIMKMSESELAEFKETIDEWYN